MRIIRQRRPDRYTLLDNRLIEDVRLSYRALGLLAYLLSRPDGWTTDAKRLAKPDAREGQKALLTALREIENAGYLTRQRRQDQKTGKWSRDFVVRDEPSRDPREAPSGGNGNSVPSGGKPSVGSPSVGNPPLSTNYVEQPRKPSTDPSHPSIHPSAPFEPRPNTDSDADASGPVPSEQTGSTDVARAEDLDLAMNGWNQDRRRRKPWAELQQAYETEQITEEDALAKLEELLDGWHYDTEESTALGMLAGGAKLIVVFNKIRKDRRAA